MPWTLARSSVAWSRARVNPATWDDGVGALHLGERVGVGQVADNRLDGEPAQPLRAAADEARGRATPRLNNSSTRWLPTKPVPPVTNARGESGMVTGGL